LTALDQSFRVVVNRHEALRTTFGIHNDEPVQFINRTRPPIQELIDLSVHPTANVEAEAYTVACREAHTPFDLRMGPLVRLVVLRLAPEEHILLGILHQIICDGWSLRRFAYELAVSYAAISSGEAPQLKILGLQYADYACWQREWLDSDEFRRQLSYWRRKLAGANFLADLSSSGITLAKQSFEGFSQARRLSEDLIQQLKTVATRHNATPFALSLTVLQIVLYQNSGETDVIVGMPVAGRELVELEEVVGCFANLVVVRVDMSGDPPFLDLLRKVRDAILEALSNQQVPFERLVEALRPPRSLARNPIFQVLFASVNAAAPWKSFGRLKAQPYNIDASASAFDLSMSCIEESPDTWWLRAEYRTDLFKYDQISGLLDHYIHLLRCVAARPGLRLSQLDRPAHRSGATPRDRRPATSDTVALSNIGRLDQDTAGTNLPECRPYLPDQSGDHVKETLADIWAKLLGARPPAATSNFFDLGGHSLMALRLASEIGRVYGTSFPVALIFQEPTIEAMTGRLQAQISTASSVISIQKDGSLPPFFCCGSMREFLDLSRALGSNQPFFQLDALALQQHRLFANEPLYASVSDLATRFRRDILSIQPAGPYYLGGMCEGGIIALEIALQLQAEGREVALLTEFDTPVRGYWRKRLIDRLKHGWSLIYTGRLMPRMRDHMLENMRRRVKTSPQEETYAHILRVTWGAIRAYCPSRMFEGEIQLFRAPRPPTWFREDAMVGWHVRASQGIRIHDVVGNHLEIFSEPLSQRIIAGVIAQAHSRSAK